MSGQGDHEVMMALKSEDFEGPTWRRMAEVGIRFMIGSIMKGKIYGLLHARGIHHSAGRNTDGSLTPQDAKDIAVVAVFHAMVHFRDKVVARDRWSPEGGASIQTFFNNQCLFEFPNAYRRWKSGQGPGHILVEDYSQLESVQFELVSNPEKVIIDRQTLLELYSELPDDSARAVAQLMGEGYSLPAACEHFGLGKKKQKSIENVLYRRFRGKRRRRQQDLRLRFWK
jgi:hypothetical protein